MKNTKQQFYQTRVMRSWWRKHGAKVLLFCIVGSCLFSNVAVGFFEIMMLTVPCGIKKVNVYWWLWYPRQVFFLLIGLSTAFG
jgi:hypothetical protein